MTPAHKAMKGPVASDEEALDLSHPPALRPTTNSLPHNCGHQGELLPVLGDEASGTHANAVRD